MDEIAPRFVQPVEDLQPLELSDAPQAVRPRGVELETTGRAVEPALPRRLEP